MGVLVDPTLDQILAFCAEDPIERVFLEDAARRGFARFRAIGDGDGLQALCYFGANVVPSGRGCEAFAGDAAVRGTRMLIGEELAVGELWEAARSVMPRPREDRPGQPVYVLEQAPTEDSTGLRAATPTDLELLLPACAATHEEELGVNPLHRDPEGFRRRTLSQIREGRSWLWAENGTILFKAEASAWTPSAVQLQQVWVDPEVRRQGNGTRGLRDLCRLLLDQAPAVCLFVRPENKPAIRLYETIGMRQVGTYRSVLF
jgi:ribosomal protein S18 acetylase RimI-like enzyme